MRKNPPFLSSRPQNFCAFGRGINQALQVSTQSPVMTRSEIGSLSKGVFERRTSTGGEVSFILKHLDAPKFVFLSVLAIIETSCPKRWAKPLSKNGKRPLPVDARRSKTSLLKFINIARRRVRARGRWQHWPHQTLTPDELGKREREREREKDFLSFGSLPFPLLKGIGNSRVAVYRKGKKIYISRSWPPE